VIHVAAFRLVPYRLPLEPPFRWRGGEVAEREGVLLRLEAAVGAVGWGDAAPERVVEAAAARAAEGYRAIKLKAGRLDPESDAEIARDVRARVGSAVELRVDANRAWTLDQAAAFADRSRAARLAYVEEPVQAAFLDELPALWLDAGLPIALDESLAEPGAEERVRGWVKAVVLKPTVLGGVAATLRLAARARAVGARPVLSAAFESGVGQRGVAALAAATGAEPAGLDPYRRLVEDVFSVRLPFDRPLVDVARLFAEAAEPSVPVREDPR
jgi:L-alanine-DL-glutamate epimerase-like enolase superfamily enzyme